MKVLVADKLPEEALCVLADAGMDVASKSGLSEKELCAQISDADGVIVRSATQVTAKALACAGRLKVICRAGVGVDNVDVPTATKRGVLVMNTPGGNTLSTAEHTMALLLAMSRNVAPAAQSMKEHRWDKKLFKGTQLAGKTLGVIGLGRVGREVAARARAFQMRVLGYDPLLNPQLAKQLGVDLVDNVDAMLPDCDYLTVHVPLNEHTSGMIDERRIGLMKPDARIVNCARGGVIDEGALLDALRQGRIAGAALDVFVQEPPVDWSLVDEHKLLTTPHLGASTSEAEVAVARQAAEQVAGYLVRGAIANAVNLRAIAPEEMQVLEPFCELCRRMGVLAAQLLDEVPGRIEMAYQGDVSKRDVSLLSGYFTMGLLKRAMEEELNIVNVPVIAAERGISINETRLSESGDFASFISAGVAGERTQVQLAGTLISKREGRVVRLQGFEVETLPEGHLLIVHALDRPGLIGKLGTALGAHGINIARMTFGRKESGGQALVVLNLDSAPAPEIVEALAALPDINAVKAVEI